MPPVTPSRIRLMRSMMPRTSHDDAPEPGAGLRKRLQGHPRRSAAELANQVRVIEIRFRPQPPNLVRFLNQVRELRTAAPCALALGVLVDDLALGGLLEGHRQVVLRARLDQRRRELVERPLTELVVVVVDLPRAL